jgi:hypothetical protein
MDDPLKILGVLLAVLLPALAGHMSFAMPGFVVGSLAGIALAFGVLRVLRTPIDERRPFDLVPSDDDHRPYR